MIEGLRRVVRGESNFDIIGRSKVWATVSALVLVASGLALGFRGVTLGLEFKGGTSLNVPLLKALTVPQVEDALGPLDLADFQVQIRVERGAKDCNPVTTSAGEKDPTCLVEVRALGRVPPQRLNEVRETLARVAGQTSADGAPSAGAVNVTDVGPSWGRQVSNKALRALVAFLFLVSLYISLRFEPKMAMAGLAALFHDLISTAGVYALVGFEVTPATVIALLTLMGFSLYDTVVVFDRVRENAGAATVAGSYSRMVNRSVNEVMMRSINTSLSSVLPVAGLLFVGVFLFGAVTLRDLALAMFVGTLVSTYSSIFVASPLLAWLKEREPRYRAVRQRAALGRPGAPGAGRAVPRRPVPAAPAGTAAEDEPEAAPETVAARPGALPVRIQRQGPRPRRRKRGKRGRR